MSAPSRTGLMDLYGIAAENFPGARLCVRERLTDNRHYLSDVLFGAALGMASGWTVVGRHGRETFTMYPVPVKGGVALAGQWSPSQHHY